MQNKLNFSAKREAIYKTIAESKEHPAAEWIYERLKHDIPDLSLGTVYRNIAVFKEMGIIKSVGVTTVMFSRTHTLYVENASVYPMCQRAGILLTKACMILSKRNAEQVSQDTVWIFTVSVSAAVKKSNVGIRICLI